ncbi:MAG: glycosyltransferase family 9 protein [Sedimentisphaerales bacterium]|nr:glycosyltransferase family 9 protein [Sedimentisphaerales bacterium]
MHILVIKLGALGDVLRTTSILPGLKEKCPGSVITWVTRRNARDLLKNHGLIDEIVFDDKAEDRLKDKQFDLVISLDDEVEACRLASCLNTKEIVGAYLEEGKVTYSPSSRAWFDMGLISRFGKEKADVLKKQNVKTYQRILGEILGIRTYPPELNLDNEHLAFKDQFARENNLHEGDFVVGLNTGAGGRWQLKALSVEKTIALANMLTQELQAKVLLLGGPEEIERNGQILAGAGGVIDAGCNNSLLNFAALLDRCGVVITSDSLAMNMAIALKKYVIAFFGPTSANEIDFYGRGGKLTAPMACLCCYKKQCDVQPNCMGLLDVGEMVRLVEELMHTAFRS